MKSQAEIDEAVGGAEVRDAELDLARQIITSLHATFEPTDLHSDYRDSLRQMLEAKLEGREFEVEEQVEETPVVDLMEALKASVAAAGKKPAAAKKKAPAKRAAPKRAAAGRK